MTKEAADTDVRLDRLERIARERKPLDAMIKQELRASEDVAELKPTRGVSRDNAGLLEARQHLAASFREWMPALPTPNVPTDASFDDELRLTIGESGSAQHRRSLAVRERASS